MKTFLKTTTETELAGSQPIKHMINRIDQILANLECAAVDGGFSLSVKDGEIVAKDLLSEEHLEFVVRFVGKDISDDYRNLLLAQAQWLAGLDGGTVV